MTSWDTAYTGSGDSVLPKREKIRVETTNSDKPIAVYCVPLDYDRLHNIIVPQSERESPKYSGYYFCISTKDLNKYFTKIK